MKVFLNGISLYYKKAGHGPAILLVHGNGEDHTIFDETAALLAKNYTVYALDSRDHGKSSRAETLGYQDMADDVVEFIRVLGLTKPYYCGFSDGGIIGLLAAGRHTELFSGLVLCGANAYPEGMRRKWFSLFHFISRFDRDPKIRMMLTEPQITEEDLKQIAVPVLLLAGERDMIKTSHTRYIASRIRGCRLCIVPGEHHGSYIVHSKKLYYLMYRFLGRIRA